VHGVSFSPSGNKLAWVSHDSLVCVVNQESGKQSFEKTKELPFLDCQFVSETNLIVAVSGVCASVFCVNLIVAVIVCVCVCVCACTVCVMSTSQLLSACL